YRGTARSYIPHEYLLIFLPDQSSDEALERGRSHYQHNLGNRVQGQSHAPRLLLDQGGHRGLYAVVEYGIGREEDSRERCRPGPYLDSAYPFHIRRRESLRVWRRRAPWPTRSARGSRALLCVP